MARRRTLNRMCLGELGRVTDEGKAYDKFRWSVNMCTNWNHQKEQSVLSKSGVLHTILFQMPSTSVVLLCICLLRKPLFLGWRNFTLIAHSSFLVCVIMHAKDSPNISIYKHIAWFSFKTSNLAACHETVLYRNKPRVEWQMPRHLVKRMGFNALFFFFPAVVYALFRILLSNFILRWKSVMQLLIHVHHWIK